MNNGYSPYPPGGPYYQPPQRPPDNTKLIVIIFISVGLLVAAVAGFYIFRRMQEREKMLSQWQQMQTPPPPFSDIPPPAAQEEAAVVEEEEYELPDCDDGDYIDSTGYCRKMSQIYDMSERLVSRIDSLVSDLDNKVRTMNVSDGPDQLTRRFFMTEGRAAKLQNEVTRFMTEARLLSGSPVSLPGTYHLLPANSKPEKNWLIVQLGQSLSSSKIALGHLKDDIRQFEGDCLNALDETEAARSRQN